MLSFKTGAALALISGFGLLMHGIIWGGIDVVICAVATVMAIQTRPSHIAEKAVGESSHLKPRNAPAVTQRRPLVRFTTRTLSTSPSGVCVMQ
jgi:hypothetical protein